MNDLVKRLRSGHCPKNAGCRTQTVCLCESLRDAADEIEWINSKLRMETEYQQFLRNLALSQNAALRAENARLRATLENIVDAWEARGERYFSSPAERYTIDCAAGLADFARAALKGDEDD